MTKKKILSLRSSLRFVATLAPTCYQTTRLRYVPTLAPSCEQSYSVGLVGHVRMNLLFYQHLQLFPADGVPADVVPADFVPADVGPADRRD